MEKKETRVISNRDMQKKKRTKRWKTYIWTKCFNINRISTNITRISLQKGNNCFIKSRAEEPWMGMREGRIYRKQEQWDIIIKEND